VFSVDGILNINKPAGITSHRVVEEVRKILGIRRVGHMGTLDPQARGVLLLGVGKGTKLTSLLQGLPKTYRALMVLGIRTDTQDAWGRVISCQSDFKVSRTDIIEVFAQFQGEIEQVPPMFSAVKYRGRPLYKYGRKGIYLERKPRKVTIMRLELLDYRDNQVVFEVCCSKGTYVRTLCDDMGQRLGCGGHLADLERIKVGDFTIEQAIDLEKLRRSCQEGTLHQYLYTIDQIKETLSSDKEAG